MRRVSLPAIATTGVALLAAGCGGSPSGHVAQLGSTTTRNGTAVAQTQANGAIAFAHCMRSRGVPKFPDPDSSGNLVKESLQQLGVSSSQFQAAQRGCAHLLPNGGRQPGQAEQQQIRATALRFSRCIRSHGLPGFPDPASDGRIPDPATAGIDQGSPRFEAANQACRAYRPPYLPSNSAYRVWARTHG